MTDRDVDVRCGRDGLGWLCLVRVREGAFATEHRVAVLPADLELLDPGAGDPERLVRAAFEYLLEREPASSILRSFELPVIGRYFPGWEDSVRRHLREQVPGAERPAAGDETTSANGPAAGH